MTERTFHLDFESRSTLPFGRSKDAVTAYQYARHPTTDLWCMSYAFNDDPVLRWDPWDGDLFPDDVVDALHDGWTFCAHNAGFEWMLWNFLLVPRLGLPPLPFEQMDCTAARAAVMALPRALGDVSKALGLEFQKDDEGARLMQRMAKPRKPRKDEDPNGIYWWDDRERRQRLGAYCDQDVETERALDKVLRPLTADQREMWLRVHRANMRGVAVDTQFARRAKRVMAVVEAGYGERLSALTNGSVQAPTEVPAMKAWLEDQGVEVESLDKVSVIHMLEQHADKEHVAELLEIRQEAGKSSVAKLDRFINLTDDADGRMRENFLFHAANTGRLGGKGAQLQNLPSRGGLKWYDAEHVMGTILETPDPAWAAERVELLHGSVPTALSSCLRGCIVAPPGKSLFVADFSNIEGRVAAWLGDEAWKLDAFRAYDAGTGPDLYKVTAGQILGKGPEHVDGTERNVMGKVPELALGFGGGVGAFVSMANIYNVDMAKYWPIIQTAIDKEFVEKAYWGWDKFGSKSGMFADAWLASETVKGAWRARHPGIVQCWADAEICALNALDNPGNWYSFAGGRCAFGATKIGGKTFLVSRLPSGRRLYRCDAKITRAKKFGKEREQIVFMGVDSVTKQWVRMSTYGGDLFQSYVQAIAYDLMDHGWKNVEEDGFEVVLSVHDELGAEEDEDRALEDFISGMTRLPGWANGCPVSAAGYKAKRYRKD